MSLLCPRSVGTTTCGGKPSSGMTRRWGSRLSRRCSLTSAARTSRGRTWRASWTIWNASPMRWSARWPRDAGSVSYCGIRMEPTARNGRFRQGFLFLRRRGFPLDARLRRPSFSEQRLTELAREAAEAVRWRRTGFDGRRRWFSAWLHIAPMRRRSCSLCAATSNITPWLGLSINGSMNDHAVAHVHDELHARALVLDDGESKLAFIVCDMCMIPREIVTAAKTRIQERTGIAPITS